MFELRGHNNSVVRAAFPPKPPPARRPTARVLFTRRSARNCGPYFNAQQQKQAGKLDIAKMTHANINKTDHIYFVIFEHLAHSICFG